MQSNYLYEGMRASDLADLVLPLISIDEFESKIDDDALVVAFYVTDRDAAADLNRFVQRSAINILDTDVSPAPDQNGHYLVFVELMRNERAADDITALSEEVGSLCSVEHWEVDLRGEDDAAPLDAAALAAALDRNAKYDNQHRKVDESFTRKKAILDLLSEGNFCDATILDKNGATMLVFNLGRESLVFEVVLADNLLHAATLVEDLGVKASNETLHEGRWVQELLGPDWDVHVYDGLQLWEHGDKCLACRLVARV